MKGFWIPIELVEMDISWTKRILIAEISQLEMLDKGCIASNNHFANKLKLSTQAISKALNELQLDGFINIDNSQSKRNFGRTITINFSKSPINFSKSPIHQSGESKENKQKNITINITSEHFAKQQIEKILYYRKSIKKSIKTQQGFNGLEKKILEVIETFDTNLDDVLSLMADNEWQSINKDWKEVSSRFKNDEVLFC